MLNSLMLVASLLMQTSPFVQDGEANPAVSAALPSLAATLAHVVPKPEELLWRDLPWARTLREGLLEGGRQRKPVLLWAMNGHPLAAT